MNRISYPIESLGLTNTVSALEAQNAPVEKTQFHIEGRLTGYRNISEVLEKLVDIGWLEAGNKEEDDRRVAVLNLLSKYSMATVALEHAKRGHPYLHHDDISMEFKPDRHHGLEMHYSVPYNDGFQPLFTLDCQLFLGKNFELNEEKSRVSFKFENQCSSELRSDVNRNGIIKMILEWFKALFTLNSDTIANAVSSAAGKYDIWVPPFENLTEAQFGSMILESNFEPEGIYIEDDIPQECAEVDMKIIYDNGYSDGYHDALTTRYDLFK
ncbi:hypothetical protein AB8989_05025 [Yersinia hibernica]|uniref:Uncharacterized protein n=1 Tax=Yersinia hibernica TaxID=2339259 RepID=A0ABX5QZA4_9GAMM|nr:hypothetical protein [Yersinia hibernica]QAX78700.1 hypothetical protein D5F51_09085 [Yersinia hibernica]